MSNIDLRGLKRKLDELPTKSDYHRMFGCAAIAIVGLFLPFMFVVAWLVEKGLDALLPK